MMHFFYKYKNIVINVLQCLCVLIFLAYLIVKALDFTIYVPTQHLDGAFQTASSLYRLNSGQLPGRDFFPYLGIGAVFAIFPLFKAMGSTLTASVFSSYSVVYLLSWLGISIIYYLIFQSKNFLHSLLAGAITYFLTFYLYQLPLFSIFAYEVSPGNSLKPVRAALPYLAAIATYLILTRCKNWILRGIFAGCIIAFSSLWSNDFAIPTMGIFSIFYCFYFYQNDKSNWRASIILFVLSAAISSCLLFILATGGHPLEFIAYNFHDVAKDQWWYFGPYVDERRVYSVFDLYKLINRETYFPLLILFFNFIMAFKNRNLKFWLLFMIGCGLFAGGALTSIGGSISGYFIFAYYWAMIVTIFVGLKISVLFGQKIIKNFNSSFLLKGQPFFSAGFTFILMVVFCNIFLGAVLDNCYKLALTNCFKRKN